MSRAATSRVCRCLHTAEAHEHYRVGTDCSLCQDCPKFRPVRLRDRFAELFRPRPEKQHQDVGLIALLDAVMVEQRRPGCECLACQLEWPDYDGEVKR